MGKNLHFGITGLLILFTCFPVTAESGREIMDKVMDNQKPGNSAMDIRMNLIDSRGNRSTRRIQTLTSDEDGLIRTITLFLEPANVRNTRFLTIENEDRDNDQWIYLPALRKVKRIAAGERDGSFMGSDFSYSDMSGQELDDSEHRILRDESIGGRHCWVVESTAKPGSDPAYGRVVSWVDKETYLTVRVCLYDEDGTNQLKEITMEGFRTIDGYWSAEKTTMETLASGHRTILETRQIRYNIDINPGYFTTNFLQTGRP